jgi:glycerol-3-phosphate acyltransferase PlsY
VDDSDREDFNSDTFAEIFFQQVGHLLRPEGMQIKMIFDRYFYRLHIQPSILRTLVYWCKVYYWSKTCPSQTFNLLLFGLPVFAYLLGSIPWGVILTRRFASIDIRNRGSGNIGATNVLRVAGTTLGTLTFIGDFLKGAVPVFLAQTMVAPSDGPGDISLAIVALAAFFGHLYPLYTKFKSGGKGVATAAGCYAVICPPACLVALLVFIVLLFGARRVSVGSLAAAAVLPLATWFFSRSVVAAAAAGLVTVFIFVRHGDNLKRLISGNEPEFRKKK